MTVQVGLLVTLEAKPGKEDEVAKFLNDGLAIVEQEPATITWYAIRQSATTFAIFDTFVDEHGRQAHLSGQVAAALGQIAGDLLASPPDIRKIDILAVKTAG
ncbi:MAG: putative quinol monooxygenase [Pseudonocardia sp.]